MTAKLFFQFDTEIACEHGVDVAIFLTQLSYWIYRNRTFGDNYREGKTWAKISTTGLIKYFPFWTYRQIRSVRTKALKAGEIVVEKFSKDRSDHTYWIAFSDESKHLVSFKNDPIQSKEINNFKHNLSHRQDKIVPSRQDKIVPSTYNKNTNTNKKSASDESAVLLFEKLWTVYKQFCSHDKKKAREKFVRLKPTEEFTDELINAINEQNKINVIKKQKGEFVANWPYLVRWLGNERWKDEVQSVPQTTQNYIPMAIVPSY